jgi:hypothetical protein
MAAVLFDHVLFSNYYCNGCPINAQFADQNKNGDPSINKLQIDKKFSMATAYYIFLGRAASATIDSYILIYNAKIHT